LRCLNVKCRTYHLKDVSGISNNKIQRSAAKLRCNHLHQQADPKSGWTMALGEIFFLSADGMPRLAVETRHISPDANTALLLAEIEALKARCMTLENGAATRYAPYLRPEHGPITGANASNYTWVPIPIESNNNFNAVQDPNANNFQWMDSAAGHATDVDLRLGNVQLSPGPVPTGHFVTCTDQPFVHDDLSALFDFEQVTFPSDPGSGSVLLGPAIPRGSFDDARFLDNSAPSAGVSSSAPMATVPVASPPRSVHQCQQCMKSYCHVGDLRRHARSHNRNFPRLACPNTNCTRQFLRMDKLREHRARKGH
jgi:hypothetical protein